MPFLPWTGGSGGSGGSQQAWQFRPETFGARGNGKVIPDAGITSGLAVLTSATANFTSADVGKNILVVGAGAAGVTLSTTIASFSSSTSVTLAATAGTTVSGAFAVYGTDDTAAINSAVSAATTYGLANNYFGEIFFSPVIYMVSAPTIKTSTNKGNSQIPLPVLGMNNNPSLVLRFTGVRCNAATTMFAGSGDAPAPQTSGTVLLCTLTGQSHDATFGFPSVIGSPTSEQGYTGGFTNLWNNVMPVIDGVTIMAPLNPSVRGFDFTSCVKMEVPWATATVFATNAQQAAVQPTGNNCTGLLTPQLGNNAHVVIGTFVCQGFQTGLAAFEHTVWDSYTALFCTVGLLADCNGGHGIAGVMYIAEANQFHLNTNGGGGTTRPICIGLMDTENSSQYAGGGFHINDGSNAGSGLIHMGSSQNSIASMPINGAINMEIIIDNMQSRSVQAAPAYTLGTAFQNPWWRHAEITIAGGTVTGVSVGPASGSLTSLGITSGVFRCPSGWWFNIAGTVKPTTFVAVLD